MEDYQSPPIVLDTNVLVAGACRHESSLAYELLLGVPEERFPIILTEPIVLEYLDVLARPAVRTLTGLTPIPVNEFAASNDNLLKNNKIRYPLDILSRTC